MTLSGGNWAMVNKSDAILRDFSGWYHIMCVVDTTQGTNTDRVKLYLNSSLLSTYENTWPSLNANTFVNDSSKTHYIAKDADDVNSVTMAEINFIDGQALTPSDFGESGDYGEWKPIEYEGTHGTNGFYLDFKSSSSLGNDASSNSNNWTANNLAATDQMVDTPTNNFCTWDAIADYAGSTFSEGNTKVVMVNNATDHVNAGNFGMTTGKWYFEVYYAAGTPEGAIGVIKNWDSHQHHNFWVGGTTDAYIYYRGASKNNGTPTAYGASYVVGDTISVALDMDNGTITFYKNGVTQGQAFTGLSGTFFPVVGEGGSASNETWVLNAGQDSSFAGTKTAQGNQDSGGIGDFYYAPPTGFLALCTKNLPDPTVIPSEHFEVLTYTGDGNSTQTLTTSFQPDFIWNKMRNVGYYHRIYDSVRGLSNQLVTNATAAENAYTDYGHPTATTSTSLTFGQGTDSGNLINATLNTGVFWNWKAGGTAVSNTNGSITSSVSANVDAGFSVISYTGTGVAATVGHGLSSAPDMVIVKNRGIISSWLVRHSSLAINKTMLLESTSVGIATDYWDSTFPDNTKFSVSSNSEVNGSTNNLIAYCFHSVDGYSKFGSYTGNGSADGSFIHLGFRPAYVLIKRYDGGEGWYIKDIARDPVDNPVDNSLSAHDTSAEFSTHSSSHSSCVDFLSNGFKLRGTDTQSNWSGYEYIYIAFAEMPFKHSNAR
jgi:hypothetical protein